MNNEKDDYVHIPVIMATETPVDLSVSQQFEYGISSTYERKIYDSQTARRKFHESQFGDNKTITTSNGEILHKSHNAAKNKYGSQRASYHQAEADHKDSLKNIHERVEKNPVLKRLLTDEDIKEVGNRTGNFQELSKHENASKKEQSELRRGIETKDVKRAVKGLCTQAETDMILTGRAAKNAAVATATITKDAAEAALGTGKETALITLPVSVFNNLVYVVSGKKDLETALKDVAIDTGNSAVSSAGLKMAQEVIAGMANVVGPKQVANLIASEFPSAEIAMAIMTVNAVKRYVSGDISGEDCAIEILRSGTGVLAYQLGILMGVSAGAVIASIVITQIVNTIEEYKQMKKIAAARMEEFNCVLREAKAEIENQHRMLKNFVDQELIRWDDTVNAGFDQIFHAAKENDAEGIAIGLNEIMAIFNKNVRFSNTEEFRKAFEEPTIVI